MGYKKLADSTKRLISQNAGNYNKANYKQIKFQLRPEVVTEFDELCTTEGVSKAEMFRKLLSLYKTLQNSD
ncbi:ribbon-helix-helix protein, CopG family [Aggregatibacter kilianii]|uniref:ribbon-helix-helix protein, CopG family n=1 Tax=Aggregatibacter kilianii TaxID=2025884 RepID=UPI000D655C6B|nr:ribbon-helix-helix protein, CopG family [Aggregatibacter kilianii]